MKQVMTLCIVSANSQYLLGMKKRGFGAGRWNGFGGKVKKDETIEQAASRELLEECGLTAKFLEPKACMHFKFVGKEEEIEVHLFAVSDFDGEVVETEEMKSQWFYQNEIPFDKMWPDDRFWFPYLLDGKKFEAEFYFKDENHLLDYKITEVGNVV
jgi:8-oxo-dGTP diphosphatase/2-hydroxy-dATP diphosphatase